MNVRNTNAVAGVKMSESDDRGSLKSTVSVLTTLSFAMKPVISAVDILQSPKSSGLKIGAMNEPIAARRLSALSVTVFSLISKLCRNQMTIEAMNMIVNALTTKSFVLSQISCTTFLALGIL